MTSFILRTSGKDICNMLDRWFCWALYGLDIESIQAHDLLISVRSFTADNCKLFSLLFEYNGQKVRTVMCGGLEGFFP